MGTNYYWFEPACHHCGRGSRSLHIGKSSAGWVFSLRIHPDEGIRNLSDWKRHWAGKGTRIDDEYGNTVQVDEMLRIITERDPNSRRHEINEAGVERGDGTYDLCDYDFG